ncbi:SIR2 family protein [Polyangium spumosum]|uniref:AAA+ ATPase domain-containing protein n=1 Tax=Polyangium spumosum TaxID=889282 RepID=A0A6N7Q3Q5_9BACT|nr:SIR2 family protein [Polyangium spumosum]MRG98659.1 hypothetical protein [Polyangium spumosum]
MSTIDSTVSSFLQFQFEHGRVVLFTGSGFSWGATDSEGNRLPIGPALAREIWDICFPGEAFDNESTLQDLFQTALVKHRSALMALLQRRLRVAPSSLPDYYRTWLSMPWRRYYTLNVDDLESAATRRFELPRGFRSMSGILKYNSPTEERAKSASQPLLEVVHLNGMIDDAPDGVTFSTMQYAERMTTQEPWYARMVADLLSYPVVFVGTPLDESLLWQHIEFRGEKGRRGLSELRPRSFLISPKLSRARQSLLKQFNVEWVSCTAEQFAGEVLDKMHTSILPGLKALGVQLAGIKSGISQIVDVGAIIARTRPASPSAFLLGDEPKWSDLTAGRAIERSVDVEMLEHCRDAVARDRRDGAGKLKPGPLLLLTGTAGSGKSTSLIRLAIKLSAAGNAVHWVDSDVDVSPRDIKKFCLDESRKKILFIDDADRYGSELAPLICDAFSTEATQLVVVAVRSSKVDRVLNPARLQGIAERVNANETAPS